MNLVFYSRNGSKILKPTPLSPEADQLKLEELDLDRLVHGEVEHLGRPTPGCVDEFILYQSLPRAVLFKGPWDEELLCRKSSVRSFSWFWDNLTPYCPWISFGVCKRGSNAQIGGLKGVILTQDEDTARWKGITVGSALNDLWHKWTSTLLNLIR